MNPPQWAGNPPNKYTSKWDFWTTEVEGLFQLQIKGVRLISGVDGVGTEESEHAELDDQW